MSNISQQISVSRGILLEKLAKQELLVLEGLRRRCLCVIHHCAIVVVESGFLGM